MTCRAKGRIPLPHKFALIPSVSATSKTVQRIRLSLALAPLMRHSRATTAVPAYGCRNSLISNFAIIPSVPARYSSVQPRSFGPPLVHLASSFPGPPAPPLHPGGVCSPGEPQVLRLPPSPPASPPSSGEPPVPRWPAPCGGLRPPFVPPSAPRLRRGLFGGGSSRDGGPAAGLQFRWPALTAAAYSRRAERTRAGPCFSRRAKAGL